jgi:4-diphosphocytidyl-2-C-methyl-D-erythritol kinase
MISYPNVKINLGLHVINKREDGFHNIETVFYPLSFGDMLECTENKMYAQSSKCVFVSDGLKIVGSPNQNLIVKAYELLDDEFDLPPVIVYLNKLIPMGAGLGGGSSDAAYMLKMLNDMFNLNLSTKDLENYAAQLGSDCAFFIQNKPAYVFGKGHELQPFELSLKGYYLVLINTGAHSNTAMAYQYAVKREHFDPQHNLKHILQAPPEQWASILKNDFELSVFKSIPALQEVKEWLYSQNAVYASMSGSGASMFGIFKLQPKLVGNWRKYVIHEQWL